jgi:tyrosyl-tRNA synthetase
MSVNTNLLKELFAGEDIEVFLENLGKETSKVIAYDIFEPNGRMHIAQAILKANIWKKLLGCGIKVVVICGDWISLLSGFYLDYLCNY